MIFGLGVFFSYYFNSKKLYLVPLNYISSFYICNTILNQWYDE